MRIAVIGAGAVGGYCAARLIRAGHEVEVVEVGAHLRAIQSNGLRVQAADGQEWVIWPKATDSPGDIDPVDLVLVAVQSQLTATIAEGLGRLIGDQTIVVPLQNNVNNPHELAASLGKDHVLAGTIFIAASRPEPGLVRQLSEPVNIYIGGLDGQTSDRTVKTADMFKEAGLPCEATPAIWKKIWSKFAFVIGFHLTAPLRSSAGEFLDVEETRLLHSELIHEVAAIADSEGIQLADDDLEDIVKATRRYGDYIPSAVQKIDEGQADEVVHMLRTVVRMGEAANVPTPMTRTTLAFTQFFNQRNKTQLTEEVRP